MLHCRSVSDMQNMKNFHLQFVGVFIIYLCAKLKICISSILLIIIICLRHQISENYITGCSAAPSPEVRSPILLLRMVGN